MLPAAVEEAVERSASPAAVRVALQRLGATHTALPDRLAADHDLRAAVVAVCAASRSLTLLLETDEGAVDLLADLDRRPPRPGADAGEEGLRTWKAHEYVRIAARDLLGVDDLSATGAALAALARDVLDGACALVGADGELAVIGMGKLGGDELNYASDIDVMFVGRAGAGHDALERMAREIMRITRQSFRIDANLRPEGRQGRLVRSVESYEAYWERWAQAWEFQALLKARPAAGDAEVGAGFHEAATRHLWDRAFDADDLRALRGMKARTEQEVERKGLGGRDLKRAAGGIRDIEFSVQLLQLVHGRHDPELRSPTTLVALAELGSAGYVDPGDASTLDRAYRFLRAAEHRLQLVDGHQVHTVPTDRAARDRLARTMGYRDTSADALTTFDEVLARQRATVRSIHERLYFRPLLEAFAGPNGGLAPEVAAARLAAFGFADADRTHQAVRELTRGLTRRSRLMHQLLPLILGWLSDAPDPDLGLLGLRQLASGEQRARELVRSFRESPETARRLCTILGTSRLLADLFHRNPDLIGDLADETTLRHRTREELRDAFDAQAWRADPAARAAALKRLRDREGLRIAARDLVGMASVDATAGDLTALAEVTVDSMLQALHPQAPFAVVAMGRFGGEELSYGSDLDVLFVFDGTDERAREEGERLATSLLRLVSGATPANRLYLLDADLRPEGRQGPLARSVDGYRTYFARWAKVWERQAMTRARPVAGDLDLGRRLLDTVRPAVWQELSAADVREIRRIKARVERERIPAGEDPQFHLKLGRGSLSDVEFTAQLLQLQHGVEAPGTMHALARLTAAGVLDPADTDVLATSYRFCERTRNRWFLIQGRPGDSLPQQRDHLLRLARSLDTTPTALRDEYRRVTRRARTVVERVFYGK